MALLSGDWWSRVTPSHPPLLKGEANLDTADVNPLNITSECLSANALRRTVVITLPAQPFLQTTAAQIMTSSFQVWSPTKPVTIAQVTLTALSSWAMTSVQTSANNGFGFGTLWNAGAVAAVVTIPSSSGVTGGTPFAAGTLTTANTRVAANAALTWSLFTASSSGMVMPQHILTIDYDTTG